MMTALIRTVILYFFIMTGLRLMGKRQMGELEPAELVLTMMLSDLATVPMQDFGIPLLTGLIPIAILLSFSMLLSTLSMRNVRFREILCGKPVILIENGVLRQSVMAENRYTLDELFEELRGQGYFRLSEIKYAILENSGHLSVMPWIRDRPPTSAECALQPPENESPPVILINDGRVLSRNLSACGHDELWLKQYLKREKLDSPRQVFLLTLEPESGQLVCVKKEKLS